uniref:Uncharacterized protein n=1 Tax=Anguilla anguilla TaxID=7936 RepID=A0A0E9STR7_ANGAN
MAGAGSRETGMGVGITSRSFWRDLDHSHTLTLSPAQNHFSFY